LDLSVLTTEQRLLWDNFEQALAQPAATNLAAQLAGQVYTNLALSHNPGHERPRALAAYTLGTLRVSTGDTKGAIAAFALAEWAAGNHLTEAGLPIKQLAQLRLLELYPLNQLQKIWLEEEGKLPASLSKTNPPANFAHHYSMHPWVQEAIMRQPSPVTPWLAEMADRRALSQSVSNLLFCAPRPASDSGQAHRVFWEYWQARSELAESIPPLMTNRIAPRFTWFHCNEDWLAARQSQAPGASQEPYFIICIPRSAVVDMIQRVIREMKNLPPWFMAGVEISGRDIFSPVPGLRLAESAPAGELKVRIHLADAPAYYTQLRQRALWFGGLVGGATLAALVGLMAAQRAFQKQQRLAEMKSNFVSSVSHELRAPVASVRLMAESLERGKITEPAKQQEYFQFIGQECRRLSALIENVLDYARIEQGRKHYEFEPTDVIALVKATVQLMEPAARERKINLELGIDESIAAMGASPLLDGRAIQQALVNLIDNAIKYSNSGKSILVGLAMSDQKLQIYVEDQGCGIPPAEQERIFERFYRVGSELRRETQGVGIGLSIVKHIAAAHGGRIQVRSAVGQGSRFTLALPVKNEL
jgi:signal transduction histidine kinase